jgi:hypothetical protein
MLLPNNNMTKTRVSIDEKLSSNDMIEPVKIKEIANA